MPSLTAQPTTLVALLHILLSALLVGMSAAALPPILRALPPFAGWVQRGIKPWACDLCMSFWGTVVATSFWWALGLSLVAGLPAFVVTYVLVRATNAPLGAPPGAFELEDSDEPATAARDEAEPPPHTEADLCPP